MKNTKESGITLIALIITIIVLLILAGVSISLVVGDNGVLGQAVNATTATDIADVKEQIELAVIGYLDENGDYSKSNVASAVQDVLGSDASIDETTADDGTIAYTVTTEKGNTVDITDLINGANGKEPISTEESFVGYYADVDGDGSVDGIIYADLLFDGNGSWGSNGWGTYSYDAIDSSSCKEYYISQESYDTYADSYGEKGVIRAMSGSSGEDRFYVMALEDVNSGTFYCWYDAAYGLLDNTIAYTENDFGEGKTNTDYVMDKWNDATLPYGAHDDNGTYLDIWGVIEDEYEDGWFVPSKSEWACFGDVFGITSSNYSDTFGLQSYYWSSSQITANHAFLAGFGYNSSSIGVNHVTIIYCVRLSTTF